MDGTYANGHWGYGSSQDGPREGQEEPMYRERQRAGYGDFRGGRQAYTRHASGGSSRQTSGSGWGATNGLGIQRQRERSRNRSRSRVRGEGPAAKEIEDVLYDVRRDWNFMTEDNCIPAQVALRLLDDSSLGLATRYSDFKDTETKLQNSLKGVVNEHHQGFSSSIGTFHQIQSSIHASQARVRALKEGLVAAKANLTTTKSEYQSLVISSRNYEEMLDMLSTIEDVKSVPGRLEARISEKRFLSAVDCLQEGLRLSNVPELEDLVALNELKLYLSNQEHVLADILTEELHNHLYLKSPYCEKRWTMYARSHYRRGNVDVFNSEPQELYSFLEQLDTSSPLQEDSARNPEADSFHYIYTVIEALSKLGRLDDVVDAVDQRLPVELFRVVERTNHEVQKRHPKATRLNLPQKGKPAARSWDNSTQKEVLEDLLGTLFARFEAIAEAHRTLHEVISGISKREAGFSKAKLTRGFKELWKLYQSEMRSILRDYISSNADAIQRPGQGLGPYVNIFRYQRDKDKKCTFKMDLLNSGAPELKQDRDEVFAIWQKFVPGLVSIRQKAEENIISLANVQQESSGSAHKMLVDADIFNISALLPSSIIFIKRFQELIPSGSDIAIGSLDLFLHDFLANVFHPQFEETLIELCSQSYSELDAFQPHPRWAQYAQKPICNGAVNFLETLTAFCNLLSSLPHDQMFSQLALQQINNYNERCTSWFNILVTRAQPKPNGRNLKTAAALAVSGQLRDAVSRIWDDETGNIDSLLARETDLLIEENDKRPLDETDLIADRKSQASLCILYTSMKWLAMKLADLRHVSDRALDSTNGRMDDRPQLKRSLTATVTEQGLKNDMEVYLPLSEQTAALFDGVVNGYRELAECILRTMRLELRCEALQGLDNAFTGSLAMIDTYSAGSPAANVVTATRRLLDFNQEVSSYLQPQEYEFLMHGISSLLDAVLVHAIGHNCTSLNSAGLAHLQLTLRVIYHNSLKLEPSGADLPRSLGYLRLFSHGPDAIVAAAAGGSAGIPPGTFNANELKALLKLKYGEAAASSDADEARAATDGLETKLRQLDEIVGRESANGT